MTLRLPQQAAAGAAAGDQPATREASTTTRTAAATNSGPETYTVVAGDNLTRIAARFMGSGDRWDELLEANADQLSRPEQLRAGMELRIPGRSSADAPAAASGDRGTASPPPAAPTDSAGPRTYTVRAGDNLTRIAAQALGSGGRWDEIFEANRDQLDSPNALVEGQVLRLP